MLPRSVLALCCLRPHFLNALCLCTWALNPAFMRTSAPSASSSCISSCMPAASRIHMAHDIGHCQCSGGATIVCSRMCSPNQWAIAATNASGRSAAANCTWSRMILLAASAAWAAGAPEPCAVPPRCASLSRSHSWMVCSRYSCACSSMSLRAASTPPRAAGVPSGVSVPSLPVPCIRAWVIHMGPRLPSTFTLLSAQQRSLAALSYASAGLITRHHPGCVVTMITSSPGPKT